MAPPVPGPVRDVVNPAAAAPSASARRPPGPRALAHAGLAGAARAVRPGGLVAIGTSAAPERAESTAVQLTMAVLRPPRRQAGHAPYALTRENPAATLAATRLIQQAGGEAECGWRYARLAGAVHGLIGSAGGTPVIPDAGRAPVRAAIKGALAPFTDPSTGEMSMHNAMSRVTAVRPSAE